MTDILEKFEEKFNGRYSITVPDGNFVYVKYFETPEYKEAYKKYYEERDRAMETMTEEDFEKWDWEREDEPDKPYNRYRIPRGEADDLDKLMAGSLQCGKDLLEEKYKGNIINEEEDMERLKKGVIY